MIRVLLVEDSVVQREILRRILAGDAAFTIVAEARNGKEAVRLVEEHQPDVVLMDIHMPDMNGVEATREIMRRFPVPIVVASATLKKRDVDMGLEALEAGALTVIAKPEGAVLLNLEKIAAKLRAEIRLASRVKLKPRNLGDSALKLSPLTPNPAPPSTGERGAGGVALDSVKIRSGGLARLRLPVETVDVIGICASTGGPPVLTEILAALPQPFAIPILLVQHITQGFEESFAAWLTQRTGQNVALATDGQRLLPGVWLAPGGKHLTLAAAKTLALIDPGPKDVHCPSGNPLFASLAKRMKTKAAGFVLTGMGDDGAEGLLQLKQAGGLTVCQDEPSSLIWGMPKSALELKAANHELNPTEIARLMTQMHRKAGECAGPSRERQR